MNNTDNLQPITSPKNDIVFFNLEKLRFIIKDGTGLDIAYAYEDLVFSEHGIFIFQFDVNNPNTFYCWFNNDCIEKDRISLLNSLIKSAGLNKAVIMYKGKFEMNQQEGKEQISVNFIDI
ncbi:MAG: hypothetical protein PHT07_05595 [Paludibacter sp.]|nr:hypothetical protein [Paludibacter sp.]